MKTLPRLWISQPNHLVEEDCACPSAGNFSINQDFNIKFLTKYHNHPFQRTKNLYQSHLTSEHELYLSSYGNANVVVLNQSASHILDKFKTPKIPSSIMQGSHEIGWVQQLAALGLLQPVDTPFQPPASQPDTLTAWLHVTNACNLRCTYCYVDKTEDAMNLDTGRAAVDAIMRSAQKHHYQGIKLKYAGGEAILNFRLIQELHQYAQEQTIRQGLQLNEVVLSNGVALTTNMIDMLRDEQIRLMISLDGMGHSHDVQRAFANGHSSAQHVIRAIDRAVSRGLKPDLSITVTAQNAASLPDVVAFALERELLFNLNFYRENEGSATSHADLQAENAQIIAGVHAAFQVIEEKLPAYRLIDGVVDRSAFSGRHERSCGAGHDYLVVDHNGGIAQCQMELERTITDVMADDPLTLIRQDATGFQNRSVDEKSECRSCDWRYWCAGGCSWLTQQAEGRTDVKSPYCNVYKAIYPELLRLEGLRLLKWGSDVVADVA